MTVYVMKTLFKDHDHPAQLDVFPNEESFAKYFEHVANDLPEGAYGFELTRMEDGEFAAFIKKEFGDD